MSIFGSRLHAPESTAPAAWIAERLGEFGTIGGLLPDGFDAYVLVRPPIDHPDADEVAAQIAALSQVAARHTTRPDVAWFAIWEGYGWTGTRMIAWASPGGPFAALLRRRALRRLQREDRRRHEVVRRALEQLPAFELPHRRYFLVSGRVSDASTIVEPGTDDRFQEPDLWWPEDHRWFVATDTDLDWTVIGGSHELIAEILATFGDRAELVDRDSRNDQFC